MTLASPPDAQNLRKNGEKTLVKRNFVRIATAACLGLVVAPQSHAGPSLLAIGELTGSAAGPGVDLSGLTGTLENGLPENILAHTLVVLGYPAEQPPSENRYEASRVHVNGW